MRRHRNTRYSTEQSLQSLLEEMKKSPTDAKRKTPDKVNTTTLRPTPPSTQPLLKPLVTGGRPSTSAEQDLFAIQEGLQTLTEHSHLGRRLTTNSVLKILEGTKKKETKKKQTAENEKTEQLHKKLKIDPPTPLSETFKPEEDLGELFEPGADLGELITNKLYSEDELDKMLKELSQTPGFLTKKS